MLTCIKKCMKIAGAKQKGAQGKLIREECVGKRASETGGICANKC